MGKEKLINSLIKTNKIDSGKISDGYHTFDELYDHRVTIYIVLCKILSEKMNNYVWRSKRYHSDKIPQKNWFLLGINESKGIQITYHLPISKWKETEFAKTLFCAPEWDGHTSKDVLKRLKKL